MAGVFKKFDEDESAELERGELVRLFMDALTSIIPEGVDSEQVHGATYAASYVR